MCIRLQEQCVSKKEYRFVWSTVYLMVNIKIEIIYQNTKMSRTKFPNLTIFEDDGPTAYFNSNRTLACANILYRVYCMQVILELHKYLEHQKIFSRFRNEIFSSIFILYSPSVFGMYGLFGANAIDGNTGHPGILYYFSTLPYSDSNIAVVLYWRGIATHTVLAHINVS